MSEPAKPLVQNPQPRPSRWRAALVAAGLLLFVPLLGLGGLAVFGSQVPLPVWAIAKIENRLNGDINAQTANLRISIQSVTLSFSRHLAPELTLSGTRLRSGAQAPLIALPQTKIILSRLGLLRGKFHLNDLRMSGANMAITRDGDGQFDVALSSGASLGLSQIFAASDRFFTSEIGAGLRQITIENIGLSVQDIRSNQRWALVDGVLNITHRDGAIAADFGLSMAAQNGQSAAGKRGRVDISLASDLGGNIAQISMRLSGISTKDLAQQFAPLAFISVLDAPITGQVVTTLSPQGLSALQARLSLGAGVLAPDFVPAAADMPASTPASQPLAFQSAQLDLSYDPALGRLMMNDVQLTSPMLTLRGGGYAEPLRADGSQIKGHFGGEWPSAFDLRFRLDALEMAKSDVFDAPVQFTSGRAEMQLNLAPFSVTIRNAALGTSSSQIAFEGNFAAQAQGWQSDLNVQIDQISAKQLLAIWPKTYIKGTRDWFQRNMHAARFFDLSLAVDRPAQKAATLSAGFHFDGMLATAMRGLPPISGGAGYGAIAGNQFTIVLQKGRTTPPRGGELDLSGSTFSIPDMRQIPAKGQLTLHSQGALAATLSLIDQPPFRFISKAGREVNFAQGRAKLITQITMPLQRRITWPDISLQSAGVISNFSSEDLAPGHLVTAPKLDVWVTKDDLRIGGAGQISAIPFTGEYLQSFGPNGAASVTGQAALSDANLRVFGVKLPQGSVTGEGMAQVRIDFARRQPAQLRLVSDLQGIALEIGAIGYRKPAKMAGNLRAEIALSSPPQITVLALQAGELRAQGSVRMNARGQFQRAVFSDLRLGALFSGEAIFAAQGEKGGLAIEVPKGSLDMRDFPPASGRNSLGAAMPLSLRLASLRLSDTINLTGFEGDILAQAAGLSGTFTAKLSDGPSLSGQVSPSASGTVIRVFSPDAGAALALAGVYGAARGGQMNLVLTPQDRPGHYVGDIEMQGLRVQSSSILAELLNAISVVGLLEQLAGPGILFNSVTGDFLLTPKGVELREGVATGGALGVTMQGTYHIEDRDMQMQGVISPIYLINGLGAVMSKRGEGVLGFNYTLRGRADAPQVRVNPLSVLLPGFLRNILKLPPAQLDVTQP